MLWTANITGGPRRVNHAAVGLPGKRLVFMFGGYCTGDEYNKIDKIDVHVFSLCEYIFNVVGPINISIIIPPRHTQNFLYVNAICVSKIGILISGSIELVPISLYL